EGSRSMTNSRPAGQDRAANRPRMAVECLTSRHLGGDSPRHTQAAYRRTQAAYGLPTTIHIARGSHAPGDPTAGDPACTMEWVAWLAGEEWSDQPECTHPVIAAAARAVNDALDDGPRQRLAELIPTLIGTADRRDDPVARHQLSVRLAAYAAERVLHLIPPPNRAVCMRAITAARAWADAPTGEARAAALAAADAARADVTDVFYAAYAARAVADAASHAANAAD